MPSRGHEQTNPTQGDAKSAEAKLASSQESSNNLNKEVASNMASKAGLQHHADLKHSEAPQKYGDYQLPDLKVGGTYDVKSGNTMWGLAEQVLEKETGHKASAKEIWKEIKALQQANPEIKDPSKIRAGELIKIPGQDSSQDPGKRPATGDSTQPAASNDFTNRKHPATDTVRQPGGDSTQPTNDATQPENAQADNGERKGWTIAINLTAEIDTKFKTKDGHVAETQDGIPNILNEVQKLKQDSLGKPDVTFVVQYADQQPDQGGSRSANGWYVHRLVIRNGEESAQTNSPSQGYAQDVTGLLKAAAPYDKGTHLAFINQGHGDGMQGISGGHETVDDTAPNGPKIDYQPYGSASPQELVQAMKTALGNRKLDLFNADCCMEGEGSFLGELKSVTDNVVASAQTESAIAGNADGQNLRAPLDILLNNPNMTGSQLGDAFVQQASIGANDNAGGTGTSTLAHFDLTKYDSYNNALNDLGGELTNLTKNDAHDRQVIQEIMNQTFKYGHEGENAQQPDANQQKGDIQEFLERLKLADQSGHLDDPAHHLVALINNVELAQHQMVKSYYGAHQGNYQYFGGLSELLPSQMLWQGARSSGLSHWSSQFKNEVAMNRNLIQEESTAHNRQHWIQFLQTMNNS